MIFITTFNKDIYDICGRNLLQSFVDTKNNDEHKLVVFFEDDDNVFDVPSKNSSDFSLD